MFPCCTIKVQRERKLLKNAAMFALSPVLWRFFRIPYLHVTSYALSRSKKIETIWWYLIRSLQMFFFKPSKLVIGTLILLESALVSG